MKKYQNLYNFFFGSFSAFHSRFFCSAEAPQKRAPFKSGCEKYTFYSYLLIFILLIISCNKNNIQKPENYKEINYIEQSKEWAKNRENQEQTYIKNWITKNNEHFESTHDGFWIKYDIKNTNPKAKPLNIVKYTAEISDIEGKIIYSFEDFGTKTAFLTKSHEIRGIEKALQLMGKDEQTTLLLNSFNAYGVYGDENKIKSNFPIKVKLKLIYVGN